MRSRAAGSRSWSFDEKLNSSGEVMSSLALKVGLVSRVTARSYSAKIVFEWLRLGENNGNGNGNAPALLRLSSVWLRLRESDGIGNGNVTALARLSSAWSRWRTIAAVTVEGDCCGCSGGRLLAMSLLY